MIDNMKLALHILQNFRRIFDHDDTNEKYHQYPGAADPGGPGGPGPPLELGIYSVKFLKISKISK